jgi:hypothetical protein
LWDREDDLAVTAELLELATGDQALRSELAARGRARLDGYSYDRTAAEVLAVVEEALG